ncbi:MAG: hypothetical protein LBL86_04445 [Coriobacteriales bacterium]|jgi:hypothetical protein|nr:hypothetical protein [Coriobacteriales bacterium]
MPCYQCSHCGKCGMFSYSMELACGTCGTPLAPGLSHCEACGASARDARHSATLKLRDTEFVINPTIRALADEGAPGDEEAPSAGAAGGLQVRNQQA